MSLYFSKNKRFILKVITFTRVQKYMEYLELHYDKRYERLNAENYKNIAKGN